MWTSAPWQSQTAQATRSSWVCRMCSQTLTPAYASRFQDTGQLCGSGARLSSATIQSCFTSWRRAVRKTLFLRHFHTKPMILPRQARYRHEEKIENNRASPQGSMPCWPSSSRLTMHSFTVRKPTFAHVYGSRRAGYSGKSSTRLACRSTSRTRKRNWRDSTVRFCLSVHCCVHTQRTMHCSGLVVSCRVS